MQLDITIEPTVFEVATVPTETVETTMVVETTQMEKIKSNSRMNTPYMAVMNGVTATSTLIIKRTTQITRTIDTLKVHPTETGDIYIITPAVTTAAFALAWETPAEATQRATNPTAGQ